MGLQSRIRNPLSLRLHSTPAPIHARPGFQRRRPAPIQIILMDIRRPSPVHTFRCYCHTYNASHSQNLSQNHRSTPCNTSKSHAPNKQLGFFTDSRAASFLHTHGARIHEDHLRRKDGAADVLFGFSTAQQGADRNDASTFRALGDDIPTGSRGLTRDCGECLYCRPETRVYSF